MWICVEVRRRFGTTYSFHLHGRRVSQSINQQEQSISRALLFTDVSEQHIASIFRFGQQAKRSTKQSSRSRLLLTGYLLGLFLEPEDLGSRFLRNVGEYHSSVSFSFPSVALLVYSSTLKMVKLLPSETLMDTYWNPWRHISEVCSHENRPASTECSCLIWPGHKVSRIWPSSAW
jgi:hypothetical protein